MSGAGAPPAGPAAQASAADRAQRSFDPVAYAHCAGVSLVLTGIVAIWLGERIALGFLLGNPPDGRTALVFVIFYFVLFVCGWLFGLPRPAVLRIEPLAAMRSLTIWRLVLVVVSVAVAAWAKPWDGRVAQAALWACLLLGAIVEGVCLGRVALAWKTGLRGAAAISLRAALPLRSGGPPPLPEGDGR